MSDIKSPSLAEAMTFVDERTETRDDGDWAVNADAETMVGKNRRRSGTACPGCSPSGMRMRSGGGGGR